MTLNAMMIPAVGDLASLPLLSSLGTLVLDLNANDYDSLTFRGATDYIEGWADGGPAGNNAAQSTEALQLEYLASAAEVNGAPAARAILANGTFMSLATMSESSDDWTMIAAYAQDSLSGTQLIFDNQSPRLAVCGATASPYEIGYYNGSFRRSGTSSSTVARVVTWEFKATDQARVRVDGSDAATGLSYAQQALDSSNTVFADYTGGAEFDGWFNRFAIFRGTLSAGDLLIAERILAAPMGVAIP